MTVMYKKYLGLTIASNGVIYGHSGKARAVFEGLDHQNYITIRQDGHSRTLPVCKLIAMMFVDNPCGYKYVLHKDGNKKNDDYLNLIWVNQTDRLKGFKNVKAVERVSPDGTITEYPSVTAAARDNNLPVVTISNYLHHRGKSPAVWRFKR